MNDGMMSFSEAVSHAQKHRDRRGRYAALLGNGFSIDWSYKRFHYESLYDEAKLSGLSVAKRELFEKLNTYDFETVIDHLEMAAALADLYKPAHSDVIADRWEMDADIVRNGLADVLAERHPDHAGAVTLEHEEHASKFLRHFSAIYTLNYDLLLYWVLNSTTAQKYHVRRRDGFEFPTGSQKDRLIWKQQPTQGKQAVFYLHGAMLMFVDDDRRLRKLRSDDWSNLIDQIRDRIIGGDYPLIVTERKTKGKAARIERSAYLRNCHNSLGTESGALFMHGLSLDPNDRHVLERIAASQITAIYVSIHSAGAEDSSAANEVRVRARDIKEMRSKQFADGPGLEVHFYDAASAQVWRD